MLRLLLPLVLLAVALPAQAQRISMGASSSRVAVGEPFAVEIRIETSGEDPDEVELPEFDQLEVLGRSQARPFSFSFGFGGGQRAQVKSEIVYGFTLRADKPGQVTIGPATMTVGGRRMASQKLTITIVEPLRGVPSGSALAGPNAEPEPDEPDPSTAAPPTGLDGARFDRTMFVRTVVDKKRAYVGEQVTVTVYLYVRGQLGDSPAITREPTLDGFWSQDLLALQRQLAPVRQEIKGRVYNAYVLRHFAAFPLRPGTLLIGAPAVEVGAGRSIFDLLNGPPQTLRREGVQVAVEALPLPPQPTRGAPTHTGSLTMDAGLEPTEVKVGDAATLRLTLAGRGNLRALSIPTPKLAGLEALAPEVEDEVTNELDQVGGTRTMRWLLLARAPGKHVIPSFVVDVFDPATGKFTSVRTQPLQLTVTGEADPATASASAPSGPDLAVPRFGPVRAESALRRRAPEIRERAWFWPSVLAAPLLLLVLAGVRLAVGLRARVRAGSSDTEGLREANARIAQAEAAAKTGDGRAALGLLSSALKGALEARLGEPIGGLTLPALETHLHRRGMEPKLTGNVIGQLGTLERARFDPDAQGALQLTKLVDGVRQLVSELGRFRPTAGPEPAGRTRGELG